MKFNNIVIEGGRSIVMDEKTHWTALFKTRAPETSSQWTRANKSGWFQDAGNFFIKSGVAVELDND